MNPQDDLPGEAGRQTLETALFRLRAAGEGLRSISTSHLINSLSRWTATWSLADSSLRRHAVEVLAPATGFSAPVLDAGLRALFSVWTESAMRALVQLELGEGWLEDGWESSRRPTSGGHSLKRHCVPLELMGILLAGNVPPPTLQGLLAGLLAKVPVFLKASSHAIEFPTILIESLHSHMPELRDVVTVQAWPGSDPRTDILLQHVDALLVFGSDETLRQVRARAPVRVRLLERGHRLSLAYVARECLTEAQLPSLSERLARDLALFDQQGCLSPHGVMVEAGGEVSAERFCEALALQTMPKLALEWPVGAVDLELAGEILQFRGRAAFTEQLWEGEGGAVVLTEAPQFVPSCLGRTLLVRQVQDVAEAVRYLEPVRHHLQAVALEAGDVRHAGLVQGFAAAGASRVCRVGMLQTPPAAWTGDGRPVLSELVRWVTIEE